MRSPIEALARALWNLRVRDPARTQQAVAEAIPCDKGTVSKLTNGQDLPSAQTLAGYLTVCQAPDLEAWKALRDLADAADDTLHDVTGVQRSVLYSFAEALLNCCASAGVSLAAVGSDQDAREYLPQQLVDGWEATSSRPDGDSVPALVPA
ncbi:helix-turn-helix transcriptional regulator, partial [Streptomyces sp. NPDC046832]|uniref:helix-turn-helix domain-containing protein n=1 Tax=Streptomyces sp. NPDC046832 TaxID=3155020 RepID=UPI0033E5C428